MILSDSPGDRELKDEKDESMAIRWSESQFRTRVGLNRMFAEQGVQWTLFTLLVSQNWRDWASENVADPKALQRETDENNKHLEVRMKN